MSDEKWADVVDFTDEFAVEDEAPQAASDIPVEKETDIHRIAQRQKQIDLGKNTLGYQNYRRDIPKDRRKKRHPRTPDVHQVTSKRAFDGQVRKWRRALHEWDPEHTGINESNIPDDADETMPDFIDINNPQTDSKNFQGKRDPAHKGLPLKLQSALRPTNKRSYCAIASQKSLTTPISTQANNNNNNNPQVQQTPMAFTLTSPPILPPGAKHVKTAHPQGGIATDWVVVNANGGTEIENEDVQGVESASDMQFDDGTMVCYSDDEGEGLQPMKLVV